ncbi:MAG: DUF4397 domain-containing protein, partial [Bryobacteraceae bacterium]
MSFPRTSLLAVAAFTLLVSGCKVNTINSFPSHPASVRFIGLISDAATLDVKKDSNAVWTGIPFGQPTDYQQFDNKQTTFSIFAPDRADEVTSASGSLAANLPYTLVAFGTIGNPATVIQTDTFAKVTPGNTQLRFMHTAFGAGGLDIYLTSPGLPLSGHSPQYQMGFGNTT